ncbi:Calcium permeable stress-gated cation channel 1 [Fusarium oxysporum f. sp. cepae]|uniref:Calcium permeable stress-gated cation channel 1 n=1 Tax=Fusarium oxysporum f. sp. cepae TaxID=396571 RepID=A0A3L6NM02_FUSOX|nr:Calcium permeable stress-gated cation channel 1 [Fusarium oxysporum f. sp. cepae]RKK46562.1 Calcium permeable stress-gated cation channel 1 [Fusarium oxysporum f. sp. cepae]RKK60224.1 Calcium permeable stress-gated cation channel 1 [Fusarium oxysporum f. sp. cepae]
MKNKTDSCWDEKIIDPDTGKSLEVQLVLSLVIGVSAFFLFCFLRPRWPALYAARKRRLDHQLGLPTLPNSTFGWIPTLFKITEEQVLASAGLDAFVFLSFFKMAIRLFSIMAFFATVILLPINRSFSDTKSKKGHGGDDTSTVPGSFYGTDQNVFSDASFLDILKHKDKTDKSYEKSWLWAYVIFTYFFVGLTIYYLNLETFRVIKFRQDYLGSQSTVTDRTFRLTGIPEDLRSEEKIKDLIEKLGVGKVEKVMLCRDWKKLDDLVELRDATLRRLEGAWATFLQHQRRKRKNAGHQGRRGNGVSQEQEDDDQTGENGRLLDSQQEPWDSGDEGRPKVNIRYGTLGLRSRNVDAIDYYEERLRRLDAQVIEARKKTYAPTDMAIVTMDSVASCQMAIQARIDPRPGRLLTKLTPAPSDLVWRNTYAPRGIRRLKSWAVTLFITALTLAFIFPTIAISSLLSYCTIESNFKPFAKWLQAHGVIFSLVQNGLPALVVSLLNVAVPYLYDFLSNHQGMISQGDVELSVISKNYFFTFFNTFFVFAVSLSGINFWSRLQDFAKDTSKMPRAIAGDVEKLSIFYICFIMLQGIGLMPFRILEAGSVFLYPFLRWLSKTPRDALELKKPPVFQYGFFLPTSLLVFNLCLIYSVLAWGYAILIVGTVYFCLGYFAFKYMVLYAMDQPQHATGGAWRIISYRIIVGLLVLEVVMVGRIATSEAFIQSVCILPLLPFTIWYSYYIKQRFEPLTKYIALRAVRADEDPDDAAALDDAFENEDRPRPSQTILRRGSTLDEYKEKGLQFVNPSLVAPLPQPWIYDEPPPPIPTDDTQTTEETERPVLQGVDSTLGIGDENVWRDNGGNNV